MEDIRVILHGYDSATDEIIRRLCPNVHVIGFCDECAEIQKLRGKKLYTYEMLRNCPVEYDYIIITERQRMKSLEFAEALKNMGIPKDKLICYFPFASTERYKLLWEKCAYDNVQGILLGNSHARAGYKADLLSMPVINLALEGTDWFDIYHTFMRCLSEYRERLKSLRFVLIDLWDYNFFNLDNSRSPLYIDKMIHDGYLTLKHNSEYENEKEFSDSVLNKQHVVINDEKTTAKMKLLFGQRGIWDDDEYSIKYDIGHWEELQGYPNDVVPLENLVSNGTRIIRKETVSENMELFELLSIKIKEFNPSIKIIFTMMPRYYMSQDALRPHLDAWFSLVDEWISGFCKKNDAVFWNYMNCVLISHQPKFYRDWAHLNDKGAAYMTSLLDKDLRLLLREATS